MFFGIFKQKFLYEGLHFGFQTPFWAFMNKNDRALFGSISYVTARKNPILVHASTFYRYGWFFLVAISMHFFSPSWTFVITSYWLKNAFIWEEEFIKLFAYIDETWRFSSKFKIILTWEDSFSKILETFLHSQEALCFHFWILFWCKLGFLLFCLYVFLFKNYFKICVVLCMRVFVFRKEASTSPWSVATIQVLPKMMQEEMQVLLTKKKLQILISLAYAVGIKDPLFHVESLQKDLVFPTMQCKLKSPVFKCFVYTFPVFSKVANGLKNPICIHQELFEWLIIGQKKLTYN